MWILLLPLLAQVPSERAVLEAEHARAQGVPALLSAAAGTNPRAQQLAVRALGRLEQPAQQGTLAALLSSRIPAVRLEAVHALGQIRVAHDFTSMLLRERDAEIRSAIYEARGRALPVDANTEASLVVGLADDAVFARVGAMRGLESLFRLNARAMRPTSATISTVRRATQTSTSEEFRQLGMLLLNAAGDRDPETLRLIATDPRASVRRLGQFDSTAAIRDVSPIVRYQALRATGTCARATAMIRDTSAHVALLAIDMLGTKKCDANVVAGLVRNGRDWRERAHALVSLALVAPAQAQQLLSTFVTDTVWQVRTYAAAAARTLKDSATLATLARDPHPNVAIAAMHTGDDAVRALASEHAGLVLAGAEKLKGAANFTAALPRVISAFNRLTRDGSMTLRDPRVALLERIGEASDTATNALLVTTLADRDPAVAGLAAKILSARTGTVVSAETTTLPVPPRPTSAYIETLMGGARARITMKGLGTITVRLLTEDAPVTVAVFAQLAESGQYSGLTFHRIVSNFVLQGGSPGADEYDGRTREFMRDEVGRARHERGTIGISTRGRDTGDGQIFFNLVDNFRLDHDYTVMARMLDGFEVMDRVQEGDVIERIEILRAPPSRTRTRRQ